MPPASIRFLSDLPEFKLSGKPLIRKWIEEVSKHEGFGVARLDFIFVTDSFLLELNKRYLQHQTFTDILTFDYASLSLPHQLCGEIYISVDRISENALKYKTDFRSELLRVMIHGVLHLCGYKDKSRAEKNEMVKKENLYLTLRKSK